MSCKAPAYGGSLPRFLQQAGKGARRPGISSLSSPLPRLIALRLKAGLAIGDGRVNLAVVDRETWRPSCVPVLRQMSLVRRVQRIALEQRGGPWFSPKRIPFACRLSRVVAVC